MTMTLDYVRLHQVMLGETNPADSKPGTIRGDYCITVARHPQKLHHFNHPLHLHHMHRDSKSYIRHEDFLLRSFVTLRPPPLISEMGRTGELWSKTKFLILEN